MSDYPKKIEMEWEGRTIEEVLINDITEIERIELQVAQALTEIGWPEDQVYKVCMVVREIVANAIIHGNLELKSPAQDAVGWEGRIAEEASKEGKKERRVIVKAKLTSTRIEIEIQDQSRNKIEFWKDIPDPTAGINKQKISGRGTFFSQIWMNEVERSINSQGTLVRLVRDLDVPLPPVDKEPNK